MKRESNFVLSLYFCLINIANANPRYLRKCEVDTLKRMQSGIQNGHFQVYGYHWEGDDLVIVPEETEIVRVINELNIMNYFKRLFKLFPSWQPPYLFIFLSTNLQIASR